jgi:two-component system, chemotaxis family, chemotaxis protein CheY
MKVLVVDDSRVMRLIIGRTLREMGHEVLEAGDGQEALLRLQENRDIEMAMVDWNMPVMNGIDFLRAMRSDSRYSTIQVMMVTSETEMSQVQLALQAGANSYVTKPFTPDKIQEKVRSLGL